MARLTRWGNSDGGLRLPKSILQAAGLRVGNEVTCRLKDDGTIILIPNAIQAIAEDVDQSRDNAKRPTTEC
jgi:antitoxin component of MazEF toxin-antitoxin module